MNSFETQYLFLLDRILTYGTDKTDRTGVGTRSIFGAQLRFNLQKGFPLLTTKKIFTKGVFAELCWLLRGDTNTKWLNRYDVHIWDEWADENGDLGPVYGKQWRHWGNEDLDQIQQAIDMIRNTPDSRRIIVNAWQPSEISEMALPPCHMMFQFEVHDGKLSCHMYQRSADVFLGVPFNIASYAALVHAMAYFTDLAVGDLIISFGDVHIYNNHFEQVKQQLTREPRDAPTLVFRPNKYANIGLLIPDDFVVLDYNPHPAIKAEVAV